MVFFITFIRALAACLITNSHYTGIYPTDLIANGGLLGDVLFFAVSGYCLCQVRDPFHKWYSKRLLRCYLPVMLVTAVYLLLGAYSLETQGLFYWFVYPTYYHFVASIVLLYIPFYAVMHFKPLKERLGLVMLLTAAVYLIVYIFAYDKSRYHIDNVREPMIRFLFFESMLLGAWFRNNDQKYRNRPSLAAVLGTLGTFVLYFAAKLFFAKGILNSSLQVLNQIVLFILLGCAFRWAMGMDEKLSHLPAPVRCCIEFVSKRTLEIYVVQYVLIEWIRPLFPFPVNWIVLTGAILLAACPVHWICEWVNKAVFRKKGKAVHKE